MSNVYEYIVIRFHVAIGRPLLPSSCTNNNVYAHITRSEYLCKHVKLCLKTITRLNLLFSRYNNSTTTRTTLQEVCAQYNANSTICSQPVARPSATNPADRQSVRPQLSCGTFQCLQKNCSDTKECEQNKCTSNLALGIATIAN